MSAICLHTARLQLVLQTPDEVRSFVAGLPPEIRVQLSPAWVARAEAATKSDPWIHLFNVLVLEGGAKIGQCGFKGPPDADGAVEIAYGIDAEQQGKGYATEAAAALVAFAAACRKVALVRAHTLNDTHASARVLTKCGFSLIGKVIDPEDGEVYRWERRPH